MNKFYRSRSFAWLLAVVAGSAIAATRPTPTVDDFKMTQPKVPVVLSVHDTIGLEYDFRLERAGR